MVGGDVGRMSYERPSGPIPGSGRRGAPRSLHQVVSVRLTARLLSVIRRRAATQGCTASGWIRDAATARIFAEDTPVPVPGLRITGWSCAHMSLSAGGAVTLAPTAGCGCQMQPAYVATA